jgi:hypothetical protein
MLKVTEKDIYKDTNHLMVVYKTTTNFKKRAGQKRRASLRVGKPTQLRRTRRPCLVLNKMLSVCSVRRRVTRRGIFQST